MFAVIPLGQTIDRVIPLPADGAHTITCCWKMPSACTWTGSLPVTAGCRLHFLPGHA